MPNTPLPAQTDVTRRLYSSFGLVLILLLSLLFFTIYNYSRLITANRWNTHTYQVLLETHTVKEKLVGMETSVRGFIISGSRSFLNPYETSRKEYLEHFENLSYLTKDRPAQQRRLQELQKNEGYWQEHFNYPLFKMAVPTRTKTTSLAAKRTMDGMFATLSEIETTERDLLTRRVEEQQTIQKITRIALICGSIFSVLLASFLAFSVARSTSHLYKVNSRLKNEIFERERAQEELRLTVTELQRSNAELEQFAYVASHDLQEPLRAVGSCVQVLQRRYEGQLDEKADKFIQHAVDGATRMQTLINDLLLYSRVGTRGEAFTAVDTAQLVHDVEVTHRMAIEESGATIHAKNLPTIQGDATQLAQVFQNLISNAIKFRSEEPPEIFVNATQRGKDWVFSIRDNGPGIEPQYFERIFVMFQRLHTRAEYPGTGIGLAICKKIIERHGGSIWVESSPGQGATFFFSIPVGAVAPPNLMSPVESS